MAKKRKRVPRASIAVTITKDPDFIRLVNTVRGWHYFGIFIRLCLEAKEQGNQGVFREDVDLVEKMMGVPQNTLVDTIEQIKETCERNGNEPWVIMDRDKPIIRKFREWNDLRGGDREGSGRPKSKKNQSEIKVKSKRNQSAQIDYTSVSVSGSVPDSDSSVQDASLTNGEALASHPANELETRKATRHRPAAPSEVCASAGMGAPCKEFETVKKLYHNAGKAVLPAAHIEYHERIRDGHSHEEIVTGIKAYLADCKKEKRLIQDLHNALSGDRLVFAAHAEMAKRRPSKHGKLPPLPKIRCTNCNETGRVGLKDCHWCRGRGFYRQGEQFG